MKDADFNLDSHPMYLISALEDLFTTAYIDYLAIITLYT